VGIARDAAGRGLRVVLVEQGDLGCATSSASSKLVHGGLRYLEHGELRLVAEALGEREVLLRAAPHIVRAMRFVLPQAPGQRPAWLIRLGLLAYDWLARRQTLPASSSVSLARPPYGSGLKSDYERGFAYSDCWVDDARLVIANARSAHEAGAQILPRTQFVRAERREGRWIVRIRDDRGETEVAARALVNAAGPWADRVRVLAAQRAHATRLRLVQGSHVVVPRLYEGDHAFILQNDDRRVVFVYAYEGYTLIGTTDIEIGSDPEACHVRREEIDYLCRAANRYFERQVRAADVLWSYCGVRALVDGSTKPAARVSRDYVLDLDRPRGEAPLLSVFGGKITTYRRLAERVMEKLGPCFPTLGLPWTADTPLPGGDLPAGVDRYRDELHRRYSALPLELLSTLIRRHGTSTPAVLGSASGVHDLGEHFGANLYAREVEYFRDHEWARDAEDVLWRRTKAGLHLTPEQRARVAAYMQQQRSERKA
jgi:glycerol-3-phosphate dehydrogenase